MATMASTAMRVPYYAAATCLLALSVILGGCGKHHADDGEKHTTVLVMRHCIRSTADDGLHGVDGLNFFNNYSEMPWPAFGVPPMNCLPQGVTITEMAGRWWKDHGALPVPVRTVVDDVPRDIATARAFLKGFGLEVDNATYAIDTGPFTKNNSDACPHVSPTELRSAIEEQLKNFPFAPGEESELQAEVYRILGVGVAGNWTRTACTFNGQSGYLDGACSVASDIVERFMMEWGGGMDLAWNRLNGSEMPRLLRLHSWYRNIMYTSPKVVRTRRPSIARAVLATLEAGKTGTTVFVGHDTELNALSGSLNIGWDPAPFPPNATMPNSALRFDKKGDHVEVSFVYMPDFSNGSDVLAKVPAHLSSDGQSNTAMGGLRDRVLKGTVAECANAFGDQKYGPENQVRDSWSGLFLSNVMV